MFINKQRPKFGVFRPAQVTKKTQLQVAYNCKQKRRKLNITSGDLTEVN